MSDRTPMAENRTLPRRQPNAAYRQREYLTETEVERLIEAARKRGRNSTRDSAAILLAYRHGLRAAELCKLRWAQVDLRHGRLHVNRAKGRGRERSPSAWARASRAAPIARQQSLCVRDRSRHASDHCVVPAHAPTYRRGSEATLPGASAHASARLRVQACQRWARYAQPCSLLGAQKLTEYRKVHSASA